MDLITLTIILVAIAGAAGYRYWLKRSEAKKPGPVVKPQGGGPGGTPPPPNGG